MKFAYCFENNLLMMFQCILRQQEYFVIGVRSRKYLISSKVEGKVLLFPLVALADLH